MAIEFDTNELQGKAMRAWRAAWRGRATGEQNESEFGQNM
jgi:hypothetical protein